MGRREVYGRTLFEPISNIIDINIQNFKRNCVVADKSYEKKSFVLSVKFYELLDFQNSLWVLKTFYNPDRGLGPSGPGGPAGALSRIKKVEEIFEVYQW